MSAILLLAMGLLGQGGEAGSFEFRNQTKDQTITIWVWSRERKAWANNKRPVVLRPKQSTRLDLAAGNYHLNMKSDSNATLLMDRVLSAGGADRLRIGDPGGGVRQFRVFVVKDTYGRSKEADGPPMTLPKSSTSGT